MRFKTHRLAIRNQQDHATGRKILDLAQLCHEAHFGDSKGRIVCLAYELRYEYDLQTLLEETGSAAKHIFRNIAFLGRLRHAYETFQECAMHFASFQNLSIEALPEHPPITIGLEFSALRRSSAVINRCFSQLSLVQQKKLLTLYPRPCIVHAEVQLLILLESKACKESRSDVFNYLGCNISSPHPRIAAVAESTLDTQLPTSSVRRARLASERTKYAALESSREELPCIKLGRRRDTIRVVRIPAEGNASPHLVMLDTYETSKDYDAEDSFCFNVPDFSTFWGQEGNFRRLTREFDAKNQNPACVNGLYRVYWNRNDELPENEFLKRTVVKGEITFHRQFFYGDVFIVRQSSEGGFDFDENGFQQYSDVPPELLDTQLIQVIFEHFWKEGIPDKSLEQEAESGEFKAKMARDRDVVLARM
ncbi:MAG: hypothetical protein M1836_007617 [Candelina mexicana]|nr:MAG: hypothetical protein M1836_007617 [Candelina mexicana]